MEKYNVLIVEDDFHVAEILASRVDQSDFFQAMHKTKTGEETLQYLNDTDAPPDIILLDVYIPDVEGLELLWSLKKSARRSEVIMITAATEAKTVEEALRAGIFDYIIKPIQLERLDDALQQFLRKQQFLKDQVDLDQSSIDYLVQNRENKGEDLPKGIDSQTLKIIRNVFDDGTAACSASETARLTGVSRPTARRYLEYLVSINELSFSSTYGEPGRPQRLYRKK
ncbi:response regulator [Salibacterium halotolerans]|uniref:Two-component system, CitB family, response regulator CitT n=1 Tax=Salibacterium halotolerans TaxID=1884432 RepID=A0A1I5LWR3_9BACI|nr:response regulator [Salibacterium halotolerans]SFP01587.1 two-component system, CitB family, response regulator CitT [Salibacterium halotolerans]